jgi:hypothetical protein
MDWDRFGDDYMGECEIPVKQVQDCIKNKGKWFIDQKYALSDPENKAPQKNPVKGHVYLQVQFVQENQVSAPVKLLDDLMK